MKIGVLADSFRLPLREGLKKAKEVGVDGVQLYAVRGEMAPESLCAQGRRELKEYIASLGLEISALCGDLGGHGFERAADNPTKIARSKEIIRLAADLGTPVVTTHIGVVPEDSLMPEYQAIKNALSEIAKEAASCSTIFAIETGPEPATTLRRLIDEIDSPGIGVNLDPANLVMVALDDPVKAVKTLAGKIPHTHAKDGVNLIPAPAKEVYGSFADGTFGELKKRYGGDIFQETPLGEGAVKWPEYLQALSDINYSGYLTIEREAGANPVEDIAKAVKFLRSLLEK